MGSILSLCAPKGRRFATPNSRFMIHQPAIHGVIQGQATDLEIQAKEILLMRERLNRMLAEHTGQPVERIAEDTDRDFWMGPEEAAAYGLIDTVQTPRKRLAKVVGQ